MHINRECSYERKEHWLISESLLNKKVLFLIQTERVLFNRNWCCLIERPLLNRERPLISRERPLISRERSLLDREALA